MVKVGVLFITLVEWIKIYITFRFYYYMPWTNIRESSQTMTGLDKAATMQGSEQVGRVKRLLKLLPLWSCFLILSLVLATSDTFFIIEATSLVHDYDLA